MDYSIIREIFLNNRADSELVPVSKEYKKINVQIEKFEEIIKSYLPEDKRDNIMWDYSLLYGRLISEAETQAFVEGFKTGLSVGAETFSNLQNNGKN